MEENNVGRKEVLDPEKAWPFPAPKLPEEEDGQSEQKKVDEQG